MISGKTQIMRQKNIDPEKMLIESPLRDETVTDASEELEQINQSIAKLTLKLNSESDDFTQFNFSHTSIHFDLTPSSSSSASSPSNLLNSERSPKSITSNSSPSKSASTNLTFDAHTHNSPKQKKSKEKFVKSSTLNSQQQNIKPLQSTNSVPLTHTLKTNRLVNFMRLGQASSFFSRSCPGDDLTESASSVESRSHKSENHQKLKNFLTFTSKMRSKKHDPSPNGSAHESANSVFSDSLNVNSSSSSSSSEKSSDRKSKIGSYEVDLEKLARELILPSVNAPLTSFKPPLQSSKTIDSEIPYNSKKPMLRSLTQNK